MRNVSNDEEGEYNQENNVVSIKDIKEVIHTDEILNSKKRCIAHIQTTKCRMSGNMSQHLVKHDY